MRIIVSIGKTKSICDDNSYIMEPKLFQSLFDTCKKLSLECMLELYGKRYRKEILKVK